MSNQPEKKGVSALDFFCLGFGAIVGVGWAVSINSWMTSCGGPIPAGIGYILALVMMVPIALCYCELVPMLPVAGGGMAGTWPVFKDGMEIRTVENLFKPVDMADLEAREKINEQVCLAFQISPENIGFRTGTNSNISAYKEKLWNVELLPYLVAFEEALNLTLPEAVGEPDCYIKANLDAKLRGTMETQYQALSTATGRPFMTTDEARELLDRPKLPGGDQLITPLNVSEGGQPSPQDGGQTQNAQQGASPNGKQMLAEFKRLYTYDAGFRASWDSMTKGETSDES